MPMFLPNILMPYRVFVAVDVHRFYYLANHDSHAMYWGKVKEKERKILEKIKLSNT